MEERSSFVVALIENRAKEVGLAAFDLSSARLHLSQFIETSRSYHNTMTLLHFYNPSELILPANNAATAGPVGVACVCEQLSVRKVQLSRSCFDDTKGLLLVQNLAVRDSNVGVVQGYTKQYYLCLGAAAAVIKWTENERGMMITNNSIRFSFNGSSDHMSIDVTSVLNLELVEPLGMTSSGKKPKNASLFGVLNRTKTTGGAKLLRANLLQPLKDVKTIDTRLDCMDELTSKESLFFGLSQVLQKFPKDLERVLCHFCFKPNRISGSSTGCSARSQSLVANVILLKEAMDIMPTLSQVLEEAECSLLQNIRETVCSKPCYDILRHRIQEVISEDVFHSRMPSAARTQQCFAVKPGIDGFLDVSRKVYSDTSEAIHDLAKSYREDFQLPSLKLLYNKRKGFYISIAVIEVTGALPSKMIQVMHQGKYIHCSTVELISLNTRNKNAATECYTRTEHCLEGLGNDIREQTPFLLLLSESVSLMDMITSLASVVSLKAPGSYVRPVLTEDGPMAMEAGRHPVLENLGSEDFVPNSTFLSEASNMLIVTGPNMSGKSTYLRQVALIAILAHIGCYVPARFCSLRVVDRLFTRIGAGDDLELNSSTFMAEMRETAFFLQNVTPRSVVFIDELGRSTSSYDGLAVAWSCSEYLQSLKVYVLFATHMQRLEELSRMYPNVKVAYFSVALKSNHLDFEYVLKEGCTGVPHYGLLLAEVAGLPSSVTAFAKKIVEALGKREADSLHTAGSFSSSADTSRTRDYQIAQRLLTLKHAKLSEQEFRSYLDNLSHTVSASGERHGA